MQFKLHTKITAVTSTVLVAVLAIVVYFSDSAMTRLSNHEEEQEAELLATRIAETIEHHVKLERRAARPAATVESTAVPNWSEVEEIIRATIVNHHSQIRVVRVFEQSGPEMREVITLHQPGHALQPELDGKLSANAGPPTVIGVSQKGDLRVLEALAPVVSSIFNQPPSQIAIVRVTLAFDTTRSYAAKLRSLMWPLMLLAIAAITVITYSLFRHLVYKPIDNILLAMSKAEEGDLAAEAETSSRDEVGRLAVQFNRMLARIRQMTEQVGLEQRRLEDRVRETTAEIAERKTQLEEANLRLFEMQRQLTQLDRLAAVGQLAAQFAHEVGTPLNLISGHVQLLKARITEERAAKRLEVISTQIERITKIVRSMLDSTRRPCRRVASTDINSLLVQILDATQPILAARNVELRTDLADQLPTIAVDVDQMQQVFINLVNNGLDAMPSGGVLSISTKLVEDSVAIEMSDTGEGIPSERINLVFDPLYSTKRGRGTGLGLTIVKQIVQEHSGAVSVTSRAGSGATFRVMLPLSTGEDAVASEAYRQAEAPGSSPAGGDKL